MLFNTRRLIRIQERLARRVVIEDRIPEEINTIAGVDQAFINDDILSCMVLLEYPDMNIIETKISRIGVEFPYIPGFLAFREAPAILSVYRKLEKKPDILLVDGHGIAHPRGIGIASHVGVLLNKATIGVAKKVLVGNYEIPENIGEHKNLIYNGKVVGFVFKSRYRCNPIFISPGHNISLQTSLKITKKCIKNHKLPEPIFLAHRIVNEYRNNF
ncbi:MAG: deoxyribonuclease V [Candidatus Altiarchaeales archaeon]|nr:MAG: deoxyribonuclease V [Candidatus Altiarchaeales archaeon]RLI94873.1 MAG: deoxyribonuclease V [Candidatus Altiarchaeales archaeon]RLI94968.1 MAG: deoxyribonuclease V [Candidatus Altiarchaeales archaeon]HDO82085.1 deoxyribonuclease V [Candidatus Altiarchaeales archaeon]HEX54734.1 deoxyribonuclease V [Candidatus Altiarchaeales archaeon]